MNAVRWSKPRALMSGTAALVLAVQPVQAQQAARDQQQPARSPQAAVEQLRAGEYDAAIDALSGILREAPTAENIRLYVNALTEVGRYDQALKALDAAPRDLELELANTRGELLYATGEIFGARAEFNRAWEGNASDRWIARLNRARLEYVYGDRDAALEEFDAFIDLYNGAQSLPTHELMAVATAVTYLGITNSDLYQDALRAYDEAVRLDEADPAPKLALAELFLAKYNSTEAGTHINQVLSRNPADPRALLARARALRFDGEIGVMEPVEEALETNPSYVDARVFKARIHLTVENHEDARDEIERALEVNPAAVEALSVLAASHYLKGEQADFRRVRDQVISLAPDNPELFNDIAELLQNSRKYREAADLAAQATLIDPRSWRGYGLLGMNQLRLGEIEAGRASLETAFAGDPYNVWFFNTLTLVDSFENFSEIETGDGAFELVLHSAEDELLRPYVEQVATEALEALRDRYDYTPPLPIRIEVFPSHGDFSVRTVGLAGVGALGVAFGSVLAMDSPAARELGSFNWASVLWHEMAHVFHLGLTDHGVPRWFSEGLAVHEQHTARPGWGHQPGPGLLSRYKEGLFLPASKLNAGFVQPHYPEQVVDSYYLASVVFEFIEARWGFGAIHDMLRGYRVGKSTDQLIEELLGLEPEDFDQEFDEYFRSKFETALAAIDPPREGPPGFGSGDRSFVEMAAANPDLFVVRLGAGVELFRDGRIDQAVDHFRAALRLFPEYGGNDSPYWFLALIHEKRGETERAAQALARLNGLNESNYAAHLKEAELLEQLGRREAAAAALEEAVFIYPYELELHEKLAGLHTELGQFEGAVRERRAILALDPVDRAEAFYQLALAQRSAGDVEGARRSVMSALEIAPSFDDALELLLELREGTDR